MLIFILFFKQCRCSQELVPAVWCNALLDRYCPCDGMLRRCCSSLLNLFEPIGMSRYVWSATLPDTVLVCSRVSVVFIVSLLSHICRAACP
jgi:hypothetical protein